MVALEGKVRIYESSGNGRLEYVADEVCIAGALCLAKKSSTDKAGEKQREPVPVHERVLKATEKNTFTV